MRKDDAGTSHHDQEKAVMERERSKGKKETPVERLKQVLACSEAASAAQEGGPKIGLGLEPLASAHFPPQNAWRREPMPGLTPGRWKEESAAEGGGQAAGGRSKSGWDESVATSPDDSRHGNVQRLMKAFGQQQPKPQTQVVLPAISPQFKQNTHVSHPSHAP